MPGHGGIRTYDLWNTSPMLCQLSYAVRSVRVCDISELSLVRSIKYSMSSSFDESSSFGTESSSYDLWNTEHWASIPKVVGSNPTVARHIFQAFPVWIHTESNITQASYSPEYITPTQQIS